MQTIINFLLNHTPLFYWTQSLWRDEAFSVWISQDSWAEVIRRTSGDFNPPLYYLLLNVWMRIFGKTEIALRGLSVFFFLLFLIAIYYFALRLFKTQRFATVTTLLAALNPMLLYFAFELRMYSLLVLLSTLSMYFLWTKQWRWHVLVTTLGLYTQPYMLFVLAAQNFYLLVNRQLKRAIVQSATVFLLFLPWVPTLLTQLKESGPMWMYPVDFNLVQSVLGNIFLGYEGTPGNLWWVTKLVSVVLLLVIFWLWQQKQKKVEFRLFMSWTFIPIIAVLIVSLVKPIYVHRYLIYCTVGEIFLLAYFLTTLKNTRAQKLITFTCMVLLIGANVLTVAFHRKTPIRTAFAEISMLLKSGDSVYAASPLIYYEALYYVSKAPVFLYNPDGISMPRYVGSIGMPPDTWKSEFPRFPNRAFTIAENGSYTINSILFKPL